MRERIRAGAVGAAGGGGHSAFRNVAWRRHIGAEAGIAVVGSGSGHRERQRAQARGRDSVPL